MKEQVPYINIHTHHIFDKEGVFVLNLSPEQFVDGTLCSVGVHPWHINLISVENDLKKLQSIATKKSVLAIGECGLDGLIDMSLVQQELVFKAQLMIAEHIQKPVIIHCVKAFDSLIRIKKELKLTVPLVVHGYNNNQQILLELLKNGFYISFGKALLIEGSNASKLFSTIAIDKLFLETDDSDVSIKAIFDKAAELKGMKVNKLKEKIFLNFKQVFKA
ncbi:MAG: TatD family hydrolase [Bacteroidia bacterium]